MMYPVLFSPVTFCLLAILKKSPRSSTLNFSRTLKYLAKRRSCTHVEGSLKVLRPTTSMRFAPPEPLMLLPMAPAGVPAVVSENGNPFWMEKMGSNSQLLTNHDAQPFFFQGEVMTALATKRLGTS